MATKALVDWEVLVMVDWEVMVLVIWVGGKGSEDKVLQSSWQQQQYPTLRY